MAGSGSKVITRIRKLVFLNRKLQVFYLTMFFKYLFKIHQRFSLWLLKFLKNHLLFLYVFCSRKDSFWIRVGEILEQDPDPNYLNLDPQHWRYTIFFWLNSHLGCGPPPWQYRTGRGPPLYDPPRTGN